MSQEYLSMRPCMGEITPCLFGQMLNTGFNRFNSPLGIHGLAKQDGDTIHLLVVTADKPGRGDFGRFLKACREQYKSIRIIEVFNERFAVFLSRNGFRCVEDTSDGEKTSVFVWEK